MNRICRISDDEWIRQSLELISSMAPVGGASYTSPHSAFASYTSPHFRNLWYNPDSQLATPKLGAKAGSSSLH